MVHHVVTGEIVWSPSAIISARACPLQWYRTYGPGRVTGDRRDIPRNRALGMVMHSALESAYEQARQGSDGCAVLRAHVPGTMDRFLDGAVETLLSRWRNLLLPDDDALKAHLVAELGAVLESLPVPRAAAILGVEEQIEFTGWSGTPFKAILDLVLRTGPESLHIRDWKRKSIKSLPHGEKLLDDVQLCEQRVAAAQRWPWAHTVTIGLFSTTACGEIVAELPLDRAQYRLDGHEVTAHRMETAEQYPPVKGHACGGCPVRPQCPAFTTAPRS